MSAPPPAQGVRLNWPDLPAHIRALIEQRLGSPVVSAVTQSGGFSPGLAARIRTADGERIFVKAVSAAQNPLSPEFHRREARIAAAFPADLPVAHLHWSLDEGGDGWVILAFDDIDGRQPAQPWRTDELDRVLDALADLSTRLTPSPLPDSLAGSAAGNVIMRRPWWRTALEQPPPGLDSWSARHLASLAAVEVRAPDAVTGNTLLHHDARADNILLTPERVYLVDWASARNGAPWLEYVVLAPAIAMQGGPPPEDLIRRHPAFPAADPDAITAAAVALAGFFTISALQPSPPGLPTLRAFQAAQGEVARAWVAQRTGWT